MPNSAEANLPTPGAGSSCEDSRKELVQEAQPPPHQLRRLLARPTKELGVTEIMVGIFYLIIGFAFDFPIVIPVMVIGGILCILSGSLLVTLESTSGLCLLRACLVIHAINILFATIYSILLTWFIYNIYYSHERHNKAEIILQLGTTYKVLTFSLLLLSILWLSISFTVSIFNCCKPQSKVQSGQVIDRPSSPDRVYQELMIQEPDYNTLTHTEETQMRRALPPCPERTF